MRKGIVDEGEENVRDRSSINIMTEHIADFSENVCWKFILEEVLHFELVAPTEGCDHHRMSSSDIQIP